MTERSRVVPRRYSSTREVIVSRGKRVLRKVVKVLSVAGRLRDCRLPQGPGAVILQNNGNIFEILPLLYIFV